MPSATRPASATEWVASLSPWPEEFGLDGMRQLLTALGDPQRSFPSVHVVGTNGKSTATRTIAALLRAEGLKAGAYTSPHVSGWHERLDCDPASFERAIANVDDAGREAIGDAVVIVVPLKADQFPLPVVPAPLMRLAL